ncbi:dUTP diphosphatase [Lentilactobacillus buchneri]|nr:dUTP diphosphatase [Lentilactobacillus sp. Egmn17]
MKRGFEIVSKYADENLSLPYRTTENAAGYDFESAADMVIPSIWKLNFLKVLWALKHEKTVRANRSSNPLKRGLVIPNGIGVIDSDYYNNQSNEGEIFVQILNFGITDIKIKKGERIAQGIFLPYLLADQDDQRKKQTRSGGFGSSGQ